MQIRLNIFILIFLEFSQLTGVIKWASTRENLSSVFLTMYDSNLVYSATKNSQSIEILYEISLYALLCRKLITKALIRLCRSAIWSAPVLFANPGRQVFLRQGPSVMLVLFIKTCSP